MSKPVGRPDNSTDPRGEFPMNVPEHISYLLFQLVRHRDLRFDTEMAPLGLTLARWRTLAIIRRIESCSMKELAKYSTIDRTTLTRSIDQLVEEGLIDRHVPPTDRRMVLLSLTQKGEAIYMQAVHVLISYNRTMLDGISDDEQRAFARALETMMKNAISDPKDALDIIKFGRADPDTPTTWKASRPTSRSFPAG